MNSDALDVGQARRAGLWWAPAALLLVVVVVVVAVVTPHGDGRCIRGRVEVVGCLVALLGALGASVQCVN